MENKHIILREAYRHYLTFKQLVADSNHDVIEYSVPAEDQPEDGTDAWEKIAISFSDLERALKNFEEGSKKEGTVLAARKEQAFYLNVIRDMRQKDVAELMGITTVSVGQYVDQACLQLSDYYFSEMQEERTLSNEEKRGDK